MGVIDAFTPDGTVEMKHGEYYELMREAAKAELIGNAVKADVPSFYINAMLTGKKPSFDDVEPAIELEETEQEPWGMITTALRRMFAEMTSDQEMEEAAANVRRLIATMKDQRSFELYLSEKKKEATEVGHDEGEALQSAT